MTHKAHEETVLKVSLAGLFHDIGKLAQGVLEFPSPDYREKNIQEKSYR